MSRINNFYYNTVDSEEYSCFVYFDTSPPIPADAEFFAKVAGSWKVIFPNEINPGEYYQRIFDLKNGDNEIQIRIDWRGETFLSETINVLVEGEEPEITPPRVPHPPEVKTHDVSVVRRVPCLIEYTIETVDPVIKHMYSQDDGQTWKTIEPTYQDGVYSFILYYTKAGEYKVMIKVMNNYWDESKPATAKIIIKKGEGDEPGFHVTETKEFVLIVQVPEPPPEPETPTMYYIVNCGNYTDLSIAEKEKRNLESKGYSVLIETVENN